MRTSVKYFLLVIGLLFGTIAYSQHALESYKVETLVTNQSELERVKATKNGLSTLILRLVNDPIALQNPEVRQAIELAPNYLTQFNYTSDTNLVLQYSQPAVTKLLQKAQLIATAHAEAQQMVIHVINVQDFLAFKQIQSYLKTLAGVQKVQLLAVDKLDMQIGLTLKKDQSNIESALVAGNKFTVATGESLLPLSFNWHP